MTMKRDYFLQNVAISLLLSIYALYWPLTSAQPLPPPPIFPPPIGPPCTPATPPPPELKPLDSDAGILLNVQLWIAEWGSHPVTV